MKKVLAMALDRKWLRTTSVTPPGGWKFKDPDTGLDITAPTFQELKSRVITHRQYQGSGLSEYPDEIEHQICATLDNSWTQDTPRDKANE